MEQEDIEDKIIKCLFCGKKSKKIFALKGMTQDQIAQRMRFKKLQVHLYNLAKTHKIKSVEGFVCWKCKGRVFGKT